jgi:hypothetical protein
MRARSVRPPAARALRLNSLLTTMLLWKIGTTHCSWSSLAGSLLLSAPRATR